MTCSRIYNFFTFLWQLSRRTPIFNIIFVIRLLMTYTTLQCFEIVLIIHSCTTLIGWRSNVVVQNTYFIEETSAFSDGSVTRAQVNFDRELTPHLLFAFIHKQDSTDRFVLSSYSINITELSINFTSSIKFCLIEPLLWYFEVISILYSYHFNNIHNRKYCCV